MNTFWCYKGNLVRRSEHLYFSLTALDLLLVCFHFKNESTDLIYWYTCLFSPLFTLRLMLCLTTVYKDISQNMHFDVVLSEFIHPCSKKRRRAQFSIRSELTRLSVCTRFRCVCVSVLFRQQSRASYMLALCLRAVLISSPDTWDWTRMHTLVVMHRRTLYENVDSAKIKVPFYTTDIDILCVASMHRIVIHCISIHISESLHP